MAKVRSRWMPLSVLVAVAAGMCTVTLAQASGDAPPTAAFANTQTVSNGPDRAETGVALASGTLRRMVERLRTGRAAPTGADKADGDVRIEILHSLPPSALQEVVSRFGGSHLRPIDDRTAEAMVPLDQLEALEAVEGVDFLRPPLVVNAPEQPAYGSAENAGAVDGQYVTKTNAAEWHLAGRRGDGVKIGIIDSFSGASWTAAAASGDVPRPAGLYCIQDGEPCDIWTQNPSTHGVNVAEIVHDMAPGASLYLAKTGSSSAADLRAAVDYLAGQGVRVITRSL